MLSKIFLYLSGIMILLSSNSSFCSNFEGPYSFGEPVVVDTSSQAVPKVSRHDQTRKKTLKPSIRRPKESIFSPFLKDPREKNGTKTISRKYRLRYTSAPSIIFRYPSSQKLSSYSSMITQYLIANDLFSIDIEAAIHSWYSLSYQLFIHHNNHNKFKQRVQNFLLSFENRALTKDDIYALIMEENQVLQAELDKTPKSSRSKVTISKKARKREISQRISQDLADLIDEDLTLNKSYRPFEKIQIKQASKNHLHTPLHSPLGEEKHGTSTSFEKLTDDE